MTVEQAALGIHRVLNAQMAEAIRLVSIGRGIDPRGYALLPLGGGGPMHACALAERTRRSHRIVVPAHPGVLSAAGLLGAPVAHEVAAAFPCPLAALGPGRADRRVDGLDARCGELMRREGIADASRSRISPTSATSGSRIIWKCRSTTPSIRCRDLRCVSRGACPGLRPQHQRAGEDRQSAHGASVLRGTVAPMSPRRQRSGAASAAGERTIRVMSGPVRARSGNARASAGMTVSGPGDHRASRHDHFGGTRLDRSPHHGRRIVTGAFAHDRSDHHRGDPSQAGRHRQRDAVHAVAQFVLADRQGGPRRLGRPVHRRTGRRWRRPARSRSISRR